MSTKKKSHLSWRVKSHLVIVQRTVLLPLRSACFDVFFFSNPLDTLDTHEQLMLRTHRYHYSSIVIFSPCLSSTSKSTAINAER